MAGKKWTEEEIQYIKDNKEKPCKEIAAHLGRTERSTQHKFGQLGLERRKAAVGDVVNGWEITEIYLEDAGSQKISMARIKSTICDKVSETRLTKMTNAQIGWPDRRRPDLVERNKTHGESGTRLYRIWKAMRTRTSNTAADHNDKYINRGITCCEEWSRYETFRDWSNQNEYSEKLTLDRINNDGNYCPENCRWTTWDIQTENKSNTTDDEIITAFGETKSIYRWVHDDRCVVNVGTLRYRIKAGWNEKTALTQKSERLKRKDIKEWLEEKHPEIYIEWYTYGY
jgi:hypothetical protein